MVFTPLKYEILYFHGRLSWKTLINEFNDFHNHYKCVCNCVMGVLLGF